jgi:hypothetical protein
MHAVGNAPNLCCAIEGTHSAMQLNGSAIDIVCRITKYNCMDVQFYALETSDWYEAEASCLFLH